MSRFGHPVIDADGHVLEITAAQQPHLERVLGADLYGRYLSEGLPMRNAQMARSLEERRRTRSPQGAWWGTHTANVLDRATAMLPALLYERLPEIGIDYSVLYPTNTLTSCAVEDADYRTGLCQAFNEFYADVYNPYADRMAMAGIIPAHTPDEAIAELEHCAALGLKVVVFAEGVMRSIDDPDHQTRSGWLWPGQHHWFDCYGLDSAHDYDPVWRRCVELGFAATFHGGLSFRPGIHTFVSSYTANHIGQFQALMYELCKTLFLGGVTRRIPELPFVFLECGVSWGTQLLCDIIEHWEKRSWDAIQRNFDPALLDLDELGGYFERYGEDFRATLGDDLTSYAHGMPIHGGTPEEPDEWTRLGVESDEEIAESFASSLYFGCEADDRGVHVAFGPANPCGVRLNAVFSSDIGHWDVTDIESIMDEAYGLVQQGLITEEDFRAFVYENPFRMYTAINPEFFADTVLSGYGV